MAPEDFFRSPFFRRNDWVRVKLSTAATVPPHSLVLVTSTTVSDNNLVFSVRQPNSASADFNWDGYLVTGPFAISSSTNYEGIATELSSPGLLAYNDYNTPAIKQVWGPKHGQFTAEKYYYGYQIVGGNTTSGGQKVTVARWTGVHLVKGKVDDTNVNALATCTVSVWDGNRGGDTTMNITGVVNPTSNLTSVNGKRCQVSFAGGTPELIFVEC